MTNKDKFLKEGVSVEEFAVGLARYFRIHDTDTRTYLDIISGYLNKNAEPTLTEDERVILRNIKNEEFNGIIGREDNITYQVGKLYLRNKYSGAKTFAFSTLYNHLFQFIKERRRILNRRIIERRIKIWK